MAKKIHPKDFSKNLQRLITFVIYKMDSNYESHFSELEFYQVFKTNKDEIDFAKEIDLLSSLTYSEVDFAKDFFQFRKVFDSSVAYYNENKVLTVTFKFALNIKPYIRNIQQKFLEEEFKNSSQSSSLQNLNQKLEKLYNNLYETYSESVYTTIPDNFVKIDKFVTITF